MTARNGFTWRDVEYYYAMGQSAPTFTYVRKPEEPKLVTYEIKQRQRRSGQVVWDVFPEGKAEKASSGWSDTSVATLETRELALKWIKVQYGLADAEVEKVPPSFFFAKDEESA